MKKSLLILVMLLVCKQATSEGIELPEYFPFFPLTASQNQIPLTGEPSTIPSDFNKNAILFFFHKTSPTRYEPLGTGFIVQVSTLHYPHIYIPIPFVGKNILNFHPQYFVTAKHVLFDETGDLRPDVYLRFNNTTNGISWVPLSALIKSQVDRVLFSTNKAVDMAIVTLNLPSNMPKTVPADVCWPNNVILSGFDSSLLLTPKMMTKYQIKEGFDMFFFGLFVQFYGSYRNYPIYRFGHLAMIPDEGISVAGMPEQKVFLMETPVYEGNSGSPAFFRTKRSIPILKAVNLLSSKSGEHDKIILAGIVEGAFKFQSGVELGSPTKPPEMTPLFINEHAGMAVIVPATYIHEVLFSTDEINNRKLFFKMLNPKGYF